VEVTVRGANQLADLAKRLRAEGDAGKGLKRELVKGITRATKPMRAEAKREAKTRLPKSGGLAAIVGRSSITTKTRTGRDPGVTILAKGVAARSTDRGFVKHPVFGNREAWVTQAVAPGWFTDTMQNASPAVRREILEAMNTVARQIARG